MRPAPRDVRPSPTRTDLVDRYLPLVHEVAAKLLPGAAAGVGLDDLVAWGTEGLLAAGTRYRPERRMAFAAYARLRIRGAIIDDLRRYDRGSRHALRAARRLDLARIRLAHALGREPDSAELARELALSPTALEALRVRAARRQWFSLDDPDAEAVRHALARPEEDPSELLLAKERAHLVGAAVAALPAPHAAVLRLYYGRGLRLGEIGSRLGFTESRASQLHRDALARLRPLLAGYHGAAPFGSRPAVVRNQRRAPDQPKTARAAANVPRWTATTFETSGV